MPKTYAPDEDLKIIHEGEVKIYLVVGSMIFIDIWFVLLDLNTTQISIMSFLLSLLHTLSFFYYFMDISR